MLSDIAVGVQVITIVTTYQLLLTQSVVVQSVKRKSRQIPEKENKKFKIFKVILCIQALTKDEK